MVTDQQLFLMAAAFLFFMGLGKMFTSRSLVKTIMAFQAAIFGVNLGLFAVGVTEAGITALASGLVTFSIAAGAAVEALALALVIVLFRRYGTLNPWAIRRLRG